MLTVVLAGLGATGTAAPLTQETPLFTDTLDNAPILQADFSVPSALLSDDTFPDQSQALYYVDDPLEDTTEPATNVEVSGSMKVPEPVPLGLMTLGIGTLAILGIYRLNYKDLRRRYRRTPRPLTLLR